MSSQDAAKLTSLEEMRGNMLDLQQKSKIAYYGILNIIYFILLLYFGDYFRKNLDLFHILMAFGYFTSIIVTNVRIYNILKEK